MPSRSLSYAFAFAAIMGAAPAEWLGRPPAFSRHRDNTAPGLHKRPLTGDRPLAPHPPAPAPTRAAGAGLGLVAGVCPPLRAPVPQKCEVLTDLHCRLVNPNYWADPADPSDVVTWAHEMNHGVSNRLHASTSKHGIYLGGGMGIVLHHPSVTITQVAARVPNDQRGKVFDLYMRKQAAQWDKSPIYILDEAAAYYTGCVAHRQMRYGKHRSETFDYARELQRYSEVLVDAVRELDPDYPDLSRLAAFVKWQGERLALLGEPDRGS